MSDERIAEVPGGEERTPAPSNLVDRLYMTGNFDPEDSRTLDLDSGIRDVIDALPFYVILVDADHRIVMSNRATTDAYGLAAGSFDGQYCPQAIHGTKNPYPGCPLETSVRTGKPEEIETFDERAGCWLASAIYPTDYETADGRRVYFHLVRDVSEAHAAREEQEHDHQVQRVLADLLTLSLSRAPIETLLNRFLDRLISVDWMTLEPRGCIFTVADETNALTMTVHRGVDPEVVASCATVHPGRCLCGRAARDHKVTFASDVDERHEVRYSNMVPHGHYCVPAISGDKLMGVLNLYVKAGHQRNVREERFLRSAAHILAGLLERHLAEDDLRHALDRARRALDGTIRALSMTLEKRDPYTAGHQERTTRLACAIGEELGLSGERLEILRLAGRMHDIGKIHVPAEILAKPGKLTSAEFELVKTHASVGYDILREIEFDTPVADVVHQHHEKLDGSGYPLGLEEDEILLEARILAVADAAEAMASHRPYRPALGIDIALDLLEKDKGTLFDERAVDACARLFRSGRFEF